MTAAGLGGEASGALIYGVFWHGGCCRSDRGRVGRGLGWRDGGCLRGRMSGRDYGGRRDAGGRRVDHCGCWLDTSGSD